jgi:hypothetical protein
MTRHSTVPSGTSPGFIWQRTLSASSPEVHDAPAAISLLHVSHRQRRYLGASEPTSPRSTARIARSRRPFFVAASGAFSSACACLTQSQFPSRTPFAATPLMRVIPAASSGASNPLSAASTASLRTAVIRTLIEIGPSPRASEGNAPGGHGRLGEAGPGLLAEPLEEFVEAEVVHTARNRRGDAVQHQCLHPAPFGGTVQYQLVHFGPRYWALSVAVWTLPLRRGDIKRKPWSNPDRAVVRRACYEVAADTLR